MFEAIDASTYELRYVDYKNIKKIRFSREFQIGIWGGEIFPEIIDASFAKRVREIFTSDR
jgi:hypothetical protein